MARENRRGPRCSNSWRPSDGPLSPQAGGFWRQQSSIPPERIASSSMAQVPHPSSRQYSNFDQRPAPATTHATLEGPVQTFKNPNLIPVVPRRPHPTKPFPPSGDLRQVEELEEEQLPQIWHTSIDELIRRTAHDYDLIMNYERDAEGGQRWLPGDIAHIRDVGKNLHRDIFALRRWQRVVAEQGGQDKTLMMHIKREANCMKLLCERVQRAINKYEQKCEFELLRDGVYAQDEDGNFYKPTAAQKFVAQGGYLQDIPRPSTEDMEDDDLCHLDSHDQDASQHHAGTTITQRFRTLSDTGKSPPPKRNLAFDFAFPSKSFDKLKSEAVHRNSEAARHTTSSRIRRVLDGRISKSYRDSSRGPEYRLPSPPYRDQSPVSTPSAQSTADVKHRSHERNNYYERNGVSRRQAKKNRARDRSPRPTAGRLGKHVLHY